jgi:hypothetical protein
MSRREYTVSFLKVLVVPSMLAKWVENFYRTIFQYGLFIGMAASCADENPRLQMCRRKKVGELTGDFDVI